MWALRRASIPLKNRGFCTRVSVAFSNNSELKSSCSDDTDGNCESAGGNPASSLYSKRFYSTTKFPSKRHSRSSKAKAKSTGEDDILEEGFSELETPISDDVVVDQNHEDVNEDGLHASSSKSEVSEDDTDVEESSLNGLESDTETDTSEKELPTITAVSVLCNAIMAAPGLSVHSAIDKWVEEGNELGRPEYMTAMNHLRKRRSYGRALQFFEWLDKNKKFELLEEDFASRLDLIARLSGLFKAEEYLKNIPISFRGEKVYRTLLASVVASNNLLKAEKIFDKMKDLDFPLTTFTCNQMLLLYKRQDKKKVADVLMLMERGNLKPDLFSYRILIDIKGLSFDIAGMEQIVENMKEEGIEPEITVQAILARHYIYAGQKEKAEALLEKMEGGVSDPKEKVRSSRALLPLYASLGKADDVQRLWKLCESNPDLVVSIAAIEAWGKLEKVEEAEAVFNKMVKAKKVSPKLYSALLKVYANNKMFAKGKELVKLMSDSGRRIEPLAWDALVKLYIEAGEIEKAESILQEGVEKNRIRPMFNSYMMIMDQYAKRGDIHNTEKIFDKMKRQSGYYSHARQFQALIAAYTNAKAPLYGIRERMKADNIFPGRAMAEQLAQIDSFRKTVVS